MDQQGWLESQRESFPPWINYWLSQKGLQIEKIEELGDGVTLNQLLEIISGKKMSRYTANPRFLSQKIDNVTVAIRFLENEMGMTVVGCNPTDIVSGNTKQIMGIIFLLTQYVKRNNQAFDEIEGIPATGPDSIARGNGDSPDRKFAARIHRMRQTSPKKRPSSMAISVDQVFPAQPVTGNLLQQTNVGSHDTQVFQRIRQPKIERKTHSTNLSIPLLHQQELDVVETETAEEKEEKKRSTIIQEILSTEQSYVEGLTVIVDQFLVPCRTQAILPASEQRLIFSDIEILKAFNSQFLERLQSRIAEFVDVPFNQQRLGDIIRKEVDFLKMYTMYIKNYNAALQQLAQSKQKIPKFNEFLESVRYTPLCRGLDLSSYLIMPIQRIPRYVMLFSDLLAHTPQFHPDHADLLEAVEKVRRVADYVNEKKREAENLHRVMLIQDLLQNSSATVTPLPYSFFEKGKFYLLEDPSRRFVWQGLVSLDEAQCLVVDSSVDKLSEWDSSTLMFSSYCSPGNINKSEQKKMKLFLFLFNDLLVAASLPAKEWKEIWRKQAESQQFVGSAPFEWEKSKPSDWKYRFTISLAYCGVRPVPSEKHQFELFTLIPKQSKRKQSKNVAASNSNNSINNSNGDVSAGVDDEARLWTWRFTLPSRSNQTNWLFQLDDCLMQLVENKRVRLSNLFQWQESDNSETPHVAREEIPLHQILEVQNERGEWRKRLVVIQQGNLYLFKHTVNSHTLTEDSAPKPKTTFALRSCSVRCQRPSERENVFQLFANTRILSFATPSLDSLFLWMNTIRREILLILKFASELNQKNSSTIHQLVKPLMSDPLNCKCADCSAEPVGWLNTEYGVFLCVDCSAVHQSMMNGIRAVYPLDYPDFTEDLLRTVNRSGGNKTVNEQYEQNEQKMSKPSPDSPYVSKLQWIQLKYRLTDRTQFVVPSQNVMTSPRSVRENGSRTAPPSPRASGGSTGKTGFLTLIQAGEEPQQLYFVIHKSEICYFKSDNANPVLKKLKPKGVIELYSCTVQYVEGLSEFGIITPSRIFRFASSSPADCSDWVQNIAQAQKKRTKSKSTRQRIAQILK